MDYKGFERLAGNSDSIGRDRNVVIGAPHVRGRTPVRGYALKHKTHQVLGINFFTFKDFC